MYNCKICSFFYNVCLFFFKTLHLSPLVSRRKKDIEILFLQVILDNASSTFCYMLCLTIRI